MHNKPNSTQPNHAQESPKVESLDRESLDVDATEPVTATDSRESLPSPSPTTAETAETPSPPTPLAADESSTPPGKDDADHQEHEAKFRVRDGSHFEQLQAQPDPHGYTQRAARTLEQTDTYLDTATFALLRAGFALRIRQTGNVYALGLKSISHAASNSIQSRLDVEAPLEVNPTPVDHSTWPATIVARIRPLLKEITQIQPVAVVHQTRHKHNLHTDALGELPLAEWSLDELEFHAPVPDGKRTQSDMPTLAHEYELEIEQLASHATAPFAALIATLATQPELETQPTSKLVRALAVINGARVNGEGNAIGPTMHLAEACRTILREQLFNILLVERGVRKGEDPEYVHDMRVAIRRARAAIRLLGHVFRKRKLQPVKSGLRQLGHALGHVRDLDVALKNLRHFRKSLPSSERKGLKPLRTTLEEQQQQAHRELIAWLDSDDYEEFIGDYVSFCAAVGKGYEAELEVQHAPVQVRHTLPSIILNCFENMRAYEVLFSGQALPDLATFHALRIQGKRLRYSLEFARHLLGEPGESLINQLKELQEHLGDLNDASVERSRLQDWSADLHDSPAIVAREANLDNIIVELTASFPARFAQFTSWPNRELLGQALMRL